MYSLAKPLFLAILSLCVVRETDAKAAKIDAILYGLSLFQSDHGTPGPMPSYEEQFEIMRVANFTTLVLWSFHIGPTGDIIYNDTPCVTNGTFVINPDGDIGMNENYTRYINTIKDYNSVEKIFVSIGDDDPTDYDHFMANIEAATANFKVLLKQLPAIDGFDFDYEGAEDPNVMLTMTQKLGVELNKSITFCPYVDEDGDTAAVADGFWLPVLEAAYKKFGYQPVVRFNLQCYAGGGGNDPRQWIQTMEQYGLEKLGITDAPDFFAPGYWAANGGQCPKSLEQTFAQLRGSNITRGFLWNSESIFNGQGDNVCPGVDQSPRAYAESIIKGLHVK